MGEIATTTNMGQDIEVETPEEGVILLIVDGHVYRLTDGQAEALAEALAWAAVEAQP